MRPIVSQLSVNAKVAVLGGGVSGLTFAYFLSKLRPDVRIILYEGKPRCGGWIHSDVVEYDKGHNVLLEKGPRTLRGVSDGSVIIVETLRDLGKEDVIQSIAKDSEANRKFLLNADNKLVQTPSSAFEGLKFLLQSIGKGVISGLILEPFKLQKTGGVDESAHSFIKRRFGTDYLSNNMLSAVFHGIYAGDIKKLSAKRTLGKLVNMEQANGSIVKYLLNQLKTRFKNASDVKNQKHQLSPLLQNFSKATRKGEKQLISVSDQLKTFPMLGFQTGLECYPKTLYEYLTGLPSVSIKHEKVISLVPTQDGSKVSVVTNSGESVFDHARVTLNPGEFSAITPFKQISEKLTQVHSNTVILVNFYLPGKDVLAGYHGFGYLVPQANANKDKLLGVIFDSVIETNFKPVFASKDGTATTTSKAAPYTKLTAMLGGHYLNQEAGNKTFVTVPSNPEILKSVKNVLGTHLSISQADLNEGHWEITIAENCLPQYHVGYDDWVGETVNLLQQKYHDSTSLGGMAFSPGPGVPSVIEDAFEGAYALAGRGSQS